MIYKVILSAVFVSFFLVSALFGEGNVADTLKISLQASDSLFISRNLLLLAQKYNIDENQANVIQSCIWDLPNVTLNHNFYNPVNHQYVEVSSTSESSVQVQQLITIAGKRRKQVSMAESNRQIAQYRYYDLLRNLRFQLHTSFYNIYYLDEKLRVYNTELPMLYQVLKGYENLYPSGFVSMKEVVRLKALLFSLETGKLDLLQQLHDNEATFRVLISEKRQVNILPQLNDAMLDSIRPDQYVLTALIDTALSNRCDLLGYQEQIKYSQTDIAYQKSMNVPNPTFIAGWDHNGGIVHNYNYLGVSFDLPFWNHNKGNLRAAEARLNENQALADNYTLQVNTEVQQSYVKAIEIERLYENADSKYNADFSRIIRGATENFVKHQMGLLEFIDLYESYKDSQTQFLQLQNDRLNAIETLSFSIGKSLN